MSAALGITKYNLLLLSLARQLQISRHISFVAACPFLNYNAFDSNYSNFYNYFNY